MYQPSNAYKQPQTSKPDRICVYYVDMGNETDFTIVEYKLIPKTGQMTVEAESPIKGLS